MNDAFLSLLGMARRAGSLSLGHDAVISSVVRNKAKLCLLSSTASPRLVREITHACNFGGKNITVLVTRYDSQSLSAAVGSKAAVMSVDDEGFARALLKKYDN